MATSILQKPSENLLPVGQPIIFSVANSTALVSHINVRYYCEVFFSSSTVAAAVKVSTLKTTPNASGSGIFDIKRVIESYLGADHTLDSDNSNVYLQGTSGVVDAPLHHIASLSTSKEVAGTFYCTFYSKGSLTVGSSPVNVDASINSENYLAFNGYPDGADKLFNTSGNYGYDIDNMNLYARGFDSKFMTDMPTQIYARSNDTGVAAFFQSPFFYDSSFAGTHYLQFNCYNSSGVSLGIHHTTLLVSNGGAAQNQNTELSGRIVLYAGIYPANLKQIYSIPSGTAYYTVRLTTSAYAGKTKSYFVNIVEECKYPVYRLCWLNKYGAWDYYNFNQKSVVSISSKKESFESSKGNWSGATYRPSHYSGGKTSFKVKSKESIVINSEYIKEDTAQWLEGLITSGSVFLIKEGSTWELGDTPVTSFTDFRDMVEPVTITNSSIARKTSVNDKLIMHTFTIEKSISNNTFRI